jgi:lipoprotein signal peptidase
LNSPRKWNVAAGRIAIPMNRLSLRNFLSPAALGCFLLTAVIGFSIDQWSKQAAFSKLSDQVQLSPDGEVPLVSEHGYRLIPGWIEFRVTRNPGAVFGIGKGQRVLFVTVSFAAVLFIFYLFAASGRQRVYQIILGMLLAGVLGNLYDRLKFGYVRDMINVLTRWPHLFPWIFNVADSLLCTGVFLMIVYSFFNGPEKVRQGQSE